MTDSSELLQDFYDISAKILDEHATKIKISTNSIVQDRLSAYQKASRENQLIEHRNLFLEVFKTYRTHILSDKSDKWLLDGEISIQWVPLKKREKESKKKEQLNISVIYKRSTEICNACTDKFKKIPKVEGLNIADFHPESRFVNTFLVKLYSIFEFFLSHDDLGTPLSSDTDDLIKLRKVIKKYQDLSPKSQAVTTTSSGKEEVSTQTQTSQSAPAANPLAGFDLGKMLGSLMQNSSIKNIMGSLEGIVSSNDSPQEKMQKAFARFADPELFKSVAESMNLPTMDSGASGAAGANPFASMFGGTPSAQSPSAPTVTTTVTSEGMESTSADGSSVSVTTETVTQTIVGQSSAVTSVEEINDVSFD